MDNAKKKIRLEKRDCYTRSSIVAFNMISKHKSKERGALRITMDVEKKKTIYTKQKNVVRLIEKPDIGLRHIKT